MTMIFLMIFLVIAAFIFLAVSVGLKYWEVERKKRVSGVLQVASGEARRTELAVLQPDQDGGSLNALLVRWGLADRLDRWMKQTGLNWSIGKLLGTTAVAAVAGLLIGAWTGILFTPWLGGPALSCAFAALPWLYLHRKRAARLAAFEKQFPEALDFIARAMKAGHAFAATLEMLANESPPPIGPEFRKLYDEQNLGAPLDVAMRKLAVRVPLIDVRFFVSAVLLQRFTGGNLGEILRNLSRVIRERFQLKGQVKAASAHGRITAAVLTVLPIATMVGLLILAPQYLKGLAEDEHGKYLVVTAVFLLGLGYYIMRRIIRIKI